MIYKACSSLTLSPDDLELVRRSGPSILSERVVNFPNEALPVRTCPISVVPPSVFEVIIEDTASQAR